MKQTFFVGVLFLVITLLFFYPIFKGQIPFPGDNLVANFSPYNSNSYFGFAPGTVPNKAQSFDVIRILFPWKEFAIKSLAGGELPFWNPYNFAGNPLLSNFQSGTFYPFTIVFLMLPLLIAWSLYIFIQPLLAAFFTYLLLREFKLSQISAFFGGFVFAFSSYMVVWILYGNFGHTGLWLPLILLFIEKQIRKPRVLTALGLIAALTCSLLAGYIQLAFYVFFFSFVFAVFRIITLEKKQTIKKIFLFIPFFLFPPLLASPQLLPTLEIFFQSARNSYSLSTIQELLIPYQHIITTFVPDFFGNPANRNYWLTGTYIERVSYIGVIPLFFIFLAFFKKQSRLFWFFALFAGIIYLLSFKNPISVFFYTLPIPFLSTTVPTRAMFLFCFAAAICSAFGFEQWQKNKKEKLFPLFIFGGVYILLWIVVFVLPNFIPDFKEHVSISKRNLILPTGIFIIFALLILINKFIHKKKAIMVLICLLTLFDLFYFFHKITPFSPQAFFYPKTEVLQELKNIQGINRSWGYGAGAIDTIFQTHEKIFSTDGYDPLFIKRYAELLLTSTNGHIPPTIPRTDVFITPGYGTTDLNNNKYRQKILNLLGVKYVLNKDISLGTKNQPDTTTFNPQKYTLVWQKSPWQIYENKEALPRIFLASDYRVAKNKEEILTLLFDDKVNLKQTVILEEKLPKNSKLARDKNAKVTLKKYAPNAITIATRSKYSEILFLSDNYYPGWKVTIDGNPAHIYRANYTFRAVLLLPGSHTVHFWFHPDSFDLGLKVSAVSLIGLVGIILILKKKKILL